MPTQATATKPTKKPAATAKPPAAPASTAPASVPRQTKSAPRKVAAKAAKPAVVKKPKLVRDSFTLPQADHDLIKQCKKTALTAGRETKKSEVLRAAIQSFAALSSAQQMAAYAKLQAIAVGRPKAK
jgi:hypothetical protein